MPPPNGETGGHHPPEPELKRTLWSGAGLAGLGLVALAFVVMAVLSWRKWPDLIIDFGIQLYIPWRLTQGAALYRDLYYFAGSPFSQYFNALLFEIFGASFATLFVTNLVLTALLLGYIYRRFLAVSDVLTATVIGIGVVVVFAFSEYVYVGNYNFIAPYSHETLHGLILSVMVVGFLANWLVRPRSWHMPATGLCLGIIFLTKPDIFLAAGACVAAAFLLRCWHDKGVRRAAMAIGPFIAAMVIPPVLCFLLLLMVENAHDSLRSVVFGWTPVFEPAITNNRFYVNFRGLEAPWAHLKQMTTHFVCAGLVICFYAVLFRGLDRWKTMRPAWKWAVWLVVTAPLAVGAFEFQWMTCGASLPFWGLTILAAIGWLLKTQPARPDLFFPFLWTVFALVFMSKLGLYSRIFHCGFILAMPAGVITLYFFLWLLPRMLQAWFQVPASHLRATLLVALLIGFTSLFNLSRHWYHYKRQSVGEGANRIVTYGPNIATSEAATIALDWINKNIPPDGTFAVVPSGITLNFLTHRINPTPDLFWDPNVVTLFGETNMTTRFEQAAPDYVVAIEQDDSEFGVRYFGDPGFGQSLMKWIKQNYKVAVVIGDEPLKDGRFGIEIFKHLETGPARSSQTNSTAVSK
jgi:hypothetical protein